MEKIPVLYVDKDSLYKNYNCFDCWDIERNAELYTGTSPIIAHPPCRLFSKLKGLSKAPSSEKLLAYSSIDYIEKHGGILEHPKGSSLWIEKNLPLGLNIDDFGGFTLQVNLNWFGADICKPTWVYICGTNRLSIPKYPISFDAPTKKVHNLKYGKRAVTPINMIFWFKEIIEIIRK